jgi:hypothetical protein
MGCFVLADWTDDLGNLASILNNLELSGLKRTSPAPKSNVKKATGYDMIPPKLVKIGSMVLCYPIHNLINMSIMASFPTRFKLTTDG